jgi:POT family proton-dependent oligopeptide transporter
LLIKVVQQLSKTESGLNKIQNTGANTILGHPESLFVLFFTEMWERFSYYGMRALLVLFLVTEAAKGGWGWTRADATSLYGSYTMLVYFHSDSRWLYRR